MHYAGKKTMQENKKTTTAQTKQQQQHGHEEGGDDHANGRCDYENDRDACFVRARTLAGGQPIGRPDAWICPMRPRAARAVGSDDNAAERYYCPRCDWCDYYCLCHVERQRGREALRRLEERRQRETGFLGWVGRGGVDDVVDGEPAAAAASVDQEATSGSEETVCLDENDYDRETIPGGAALVLGAGGRGAVEGGVVAVDEGGELATRQALVGTVVVDEVGAKTPAAGCDDGRQGAGRSNDVSLERRRHPRKQLLQPMEDYSRWTDEELAELGRSLDVGDVRVCCSWTMAEDDDADDATSGRLRRCCAWIRRDWTKESLPTFAEDEEDTEGYEDANEEHDDSEETKQWPSPSWRTPLGGIVYDEQQRQPPPRPERRLATKEEERSWRARAQAAVDLDNLRAAIDRAEEELERRKRTTREREEYVRALEEMEGASAKKAKKTASMILEPTDRNPNDLRASSKKRLAIRRRAAKRLANRLDAAKKKNKE